MNLSPNHPIKAARHSAKVFALAILIALLIACDSNNSLTSKTTESVAVVRPATGPVPATETEPAPTREPEPQPEPQQPPQPPTMADITDVILVTGQSNALGGGTSFDATIDTSDDRVFAYTNNGWQVASLYQIWDQGWFPRTNPGTDPANNFSLHFSKRVVERRGDRVVGFVLITAPGQPISHWDPQDSFFDEIRNKVSLAVNDLPHRSSIDGILWHQGESDGRDDHAYGDTLYNLIAAFQNEPWYDPGRPFICGETASLPVNNQLRKLNWDDNPNTGCIEAQGLPTFEDGSHFTADALRIMGQRYGDAYINMTQ